MTRPLWQIDRELTRASMAKATTDAGDLRWQRAMTRIDKLLDERLVAEVEQLLLEEQG